MTGLPAADLVPKLADVIVGWDAATTVFLRRSVPAFVGTTERALPNTDLLGLDCLGALASFVYNRGPTFNRDGDRFREMRAIRDHMADRAFHLIPGELRSMRRVWQDKPQSAGLLVRRDVEADLFERGLLRPAAAARMAGAMSFATVEPAQGLLSTMGDWFQSVVAEPTRNQLMFPLDAGDGAEIVPDESYVAVRLLSVRLVNARRWYSRYHGAVHATCGMLSQGAGSPHLERQAVLAPDGFRDLDPGGQGKLLQVDRPVFGPAPHCGNLQLALALLSVKSSDLAGPYLSLLSELSQTASLGLLSAAAPFAAPLAKTAGLLFSTSDAASLECGVVRGFDPLRSGAWVCLGATRDDWMDIPALKAAWDSIVASLVAGRDEDAMAGTKAFRRLCMAGGDLTDRDAARLAGKADRKVAQTTGAPAASAMSLRSLDLHSDELAATGEK